MKYYNGNVLLTEDKDFNIIPEANVIEYRDEMFLVSYLVKDFKKAKGGNSSVFLISNSKDLKEEYVIKISKYFKPNRTIGKNHQKRYGRFIEEIDALMTMKENGKDNIVSIIDNGFITINGKEFPYYVMEKADTDLKEFILTNKEIDIQEKIKFCIHIYNALADLHSEGYYHRDIKPDNVLLFYEDPDTKTKVTWKIGDLGLSRHRDRDYDDIGERIGPFGWLSPEACNKFLTEKAGSEFDCIIDDQSDIFQLGKLFWFILQGNIPVGQLKIEDFIPEISHKAIIFSVVEEMLAYSKNRRITMKTLGEILDDVKIEFAI